MKFVIAKKSFVAAAAAVVGAAAQKASMASLCSVLVDVDESGTLTLTATDLFTGVRGRASATVSEPGSLLIPASQLLTAIKALPDGDVAVRVDGNRVEFKVGKLKQRLPWSPASEFPSLPQMDAARSVGLSAATLLAAIGSVAHCMSTDELRANMCGVAIEIGKGRVRGIATNGHALARRDVECSVEGFNVLLPNASVGEIRRLLEGAKDESVNVAVHDGYVFVERGEVALSAKLTGEVFPLHYERIIPTKHNHRAVVAREVMLAAVNCARTQDGGHPLELRFESGSISVLTAAHEKGDASGIVDADYAGDGLAIGVSGQYLASALSCLTADLVAMQTEGPLAPFAIVPAEGADAVQIIMPARL